MWRVPIKLQSVIFFQGFHDFICLLSYYRAILFTHRGRYSSSIYYSTKHNFLSTPNPSDLLDSRLLSFFAFIITKYKTHTSEFGHTFINDQCYGSHYTTNNKRHVQILAHYSVYAPECYNRAKMLCFVSMFQNLSVHLPFSKIRKVTLSILPIFTLHVSRFTVCF